ncbi:hypothetical protein Tco_0929293, partial [Tanacetum coccineum]
EAGMVTEGERSDPCLTERDAHHLLYILDLTLVTTWLSVGHDMALGWCGESDARIPVILTRYAIKRLKPSLKRHWYLWMYQGEVFANVVLRRAGDNFQALFTDGTVWVTLFWRLRTYDHKISLTHSLSSLLGPARSEQGGFSCGVRREADKGICFMWFAVNGQREIGNYCSDIIFRKLITHSVRNRFNNSKDLIFCNLKLITGKKALADGGLTEYGMDEINKTRCGVLIGSGAWKGRDPKGRVTSDIGDVVQWQTDTNIFTVDI